MEFDHYPQYSHIDTELVDKVVYKLKAQGIFDQFRKDCLADVDTKPAFQNLQQRVNGTVATFLASHKWRHDLNKSQLRENLRRHVQQNFLEVGVDRIVEQVVNPKICPVFLPRVEDVVYDCLGIEKPKNTRTNNCHSTVSQSSGSGSEKKDSSPLSLLPKDLDPVSPESVHNLDEGLVNDESTNLNTEEGGGSKGFGSRVDLNEISNDSHLSGISELTSHGSFKDFSESAHMPEKSNINGSGLNHDSLSRNRTPLPLSENSSGSEFDNFSNLKEKLKKTDHLTTAPRRNSKDEESASLPIEEEEDTLENGAKSFFQQETEDKLAGKSSEVSQEGVSKVDDSSSASGKLGWDDSRSSDLGNKEKNKLRKEKSRSSRDEKHKSSRKSKNDTDSEQTLSDKDQKSDIPSDKESKKEEGESLVKGVDQAREHDSKDVKESSAKSEKKYSSSNHHSSSSRERKHSEHRSKDHKRDRDDSKHKSSSERKDESKERKSKEKSQESHRRHSSKDDKSRSNSSRKEKGEEKGSSDKCRTEGGSSTSKSKDNKPKEEQNKHSSGEKKDKKESSSKSKDEERKDREKQRSRESKSKHGEKSSGSSDLKKSGDGDGKSKKGESSSRQNHASSSSKSRNGEERRDVKKRKGERCKEEVKHKEARRSTDRDSNGGGSGGFFERSHKEGKKGGDSESTQAQNSEKHSNDSKESTRNSNDKRPTEEPPNDIDLILLKINSSIEEVQEERDRSIPTYSEDDNENQVKKPKIAKNIFEIRKIMQARKNIDRKKRKDVIRRNVSQNEGSEDGGENVPLPGNKSEFITRVSDVNENVDSNNFYGKQNLEDRLGNSGIKNTEVSRRASIVSTGNCTTRMSEEELKPGDGLIAGEGFKGFTEVDITDSDQKTQLFDSYMSRVNTFIPFVVKSVSSLSPRLRIEKCSVPQTCGKRKQTLLDKNLNNVSPEHSSKIKKSHKQSDEGKKERKDLNKEDMANGNDYDSKLMGKNGCFVMVHMMSNSEILDATKRVINEGPDIENCTVLDKSRVTIAETCIEEISAYELGESFSSDIGDSKPLSQSLTETMLDNLLKESSFVVSDYSEQDCHNSGQEDFWLKVNSSLEDESAEKSKSNDNSDTSRFSTDSFSCGESPKRRKRCDEGR